MCTWSPGPGMGGGGGGGRMSLVNEGPRDRFGVPTVGVTWPDELFELGCDGGGGGACDGRLAIGIEPVRLVGVPD